MTDPQVCPQCPWRRSVKPGALGGSPVEKYIGQVYGPFVLPCHMHCDFKDPKWKEKVADTPQCIGAAMFREKNVGPDFLPKAILIVKHDKNIVFSTPQEFAAHHLQVPLASIKRIMGEREITIFIMRQMMEAREKLAVSGSGVTVMTEGVDQPLDPRGSVGVPNAVAESKHWKSWG